MTQVPAGEGKEEGELEKRTTSDGKREGRTKQPTTATDTERRATPVSSERRGESVSLSSLLQQDSPNEQGNLNEIERRLQGILRGGHNYYTPQATSKSTSSRSLTGGLPTGESLTPNYSGRPTGRSTGRSTGWPTGRVLEGSFFR